VTKKQQALIAVLGVLVGVFGLGIAILSLTALPRLTECIGERNACSTEAAAAWSTLANRTPTVVYVPGTPTVITITQEVIRVETVVVTATPLPSPAAYPVCDGSSLPCMHVARTGDFWSALAQLYWGNVCRWPELATLNRQLDGTYSSIRSGQVYFMPEPAVSYPPSMIIQPGVLQAIPACVLDHRQGHLLTTLPCAYAIPTDYPVYGYNYDELALRFYGSASLGSHIRLANLASGCSSSGSADEWPEPLLLAPGVVVVVPTRPLE
jgi:hypothetical protein